MFYNPKTLEKAGITELPKTWDEFKAMAETLKAAGIAPSPWDPRTAGPPSSGSTTCCCAPPAPNTAPS